MTLTHHQTFEHELLGSFTVLHLDADVVHDGELAGLDAVARLDVSLRSRTGLRRAAPVADQLFSGREPACVLAKVPL